MERAGFDNESLYSPYDISEARVLIVADVPLFLASEENTLRAIAGVFPICGALSSNTASRYCAAINRAAPVDLPE